MQTTFLTLLSLEDINNKRNTTTKPQSPQNDNWDKTLKKVLYDLYPKYLPGCEQNLWRLWIGTGINFFSGLIQLQNFTSFLKIRIPITYCMINGSYILFNGNTFT